MKKKNKIIFSAIILAALIITFMLGGNAPTQIANSSNGIETESKALTEASNTNESKTVSKASDENESKTVSEVSNKNQDNTTEEIQSKADKVIREVPEEIKEEPAIEPKKTEPVLIEPENAVINDTELTCTLSVRCDTILDNISMLDKEKIEIVPSDGIIYVEEKVIFYEGESVFDVLLREMKNNKIHFEFVNTPIYNSAYVEGIANLYEFDCGELSGWTYKVNDWSPNYGCSRYSLKDGDKIEWLYTCDLGADVGTSNSLIGE